MEFNFLIGGEAGQGVQTVGSILTMSLAKGGYHIFADQDYESRVRGGHNFFRIRACDRPVLAASEEIDVVVALNYETVRLHESELSKGGAILYDGEKSKEERDEPYLLSVPFERLAIENTGNKIMGNTVALGAVLGMLEYDFEILSSVLRKTFGRRKPELVEENEKAAKAGREYVKDMNWVDTNRRMTAIDKSRRMVINGVEAVALGAMAAGCKFMSGYPMTPSTGILQYFAGKADNFNLLFEQAEDEIAALNMVLGASYAGVRSMTATSGGGFSLMVEALSLAGMTETPAVIALGQRVGPATGLPTRTEQGELEFAIYSGHGMFPRVVFAPGTVEEAFHLTVKAFNLADRYQVPAIILTDTYLLDSYVTTEKFDFSSVRVERGDFLSEDEVNALGKYGYMRHKLTESGVSPRVIPGTVGVVVVTDSDEHTEDGHITESAEVRNKMVAKRLKKVDALRKEIAAPITYGPSKASTVMISWGSTYGALREAINALNRSDEVARMVQVSEIWPFPVEGFMGAMKGAERIIVVENNATGQFAHLMRGETGLEATGKILKFDGRPITSNYIVERFPWR